MPGFPGAEFSRGVTHHRASSVTRFVIDFRASILSKKERANLVTHRSSCGRITFPSSEKSACRRVARPEDIKKAKLANKNGVIWWGFNLPWA